MADRIKFGYMNYDEIADRLIQGKLNVYDSVYTKDTHELIFITPHENDYIRIKSRIDVYNSIVQAEAQLNLKSDTHLGQIVGIYGSDGWIHAYNVNYADNKFIVRPVGIEEYRQLQGKPSINNVELVGNKTSEDLGINIPTKYSDLYDDIGYVTFEHLVENYYSKSETYSKNETNILLESKADVGSVPSVISDLQDVNISNISAGQILKWDGITNKFINSDESNSIVIKTKAEWEQVPQMRSVKGTWYIYSDWRQEEDPQTHEVINIPRAKLGDEYGTYVVDLPFVTSSITDADIQKWNNKVSVMVDENTHRLIFIEG